MAEKAFIELRKARRNSAVYLQLRFQYLQLQAERRSAALSEMRSFVNLGSDRLLPLHRNKKGDSFESPSTMPRTGFEPLNQPPTTLKKRIFEAKMPLYLQLQIQYLQLHLKQVLKAEILHAEIFTLMDAAFVTRIVREDEMVGSFSVSAIRRSRPVSVPADVIHSLRIR